MGIAANQRANLFEPFVRIESGEHGAVKGAGLGLSISRRLVELMGGEIQVESIPGVGSEFSFCADFGVGKYQAIASDADQSVSRAPVNLDGLRILLVDDDPLNRMIGEELLKILGCSPVCAEDAAAARAALEHETFHAVLMDIEMPIMTGDELSRQLRADPRWQHLPIIALTAHATMEIRELCLTSGMDGYLAKPFTLDQLRTVLLRWVNKTDSAS